jgi:hypothetical protein
MDNRQQLDNRQMPMDNRQLHMDNRQMPVDNRQLPMDNRQMPVDNRQLPMDNRQLRNRQLPMDNRQQLDNRQMPMDNRHFPGDNRQLPMDNRQLPMDNRQLPMDNRQLPIDNRPIPRDNRQLPMDNRQLPMDNRIRTFGDDDYLSPRVGSLLGSTADMSPRSTNNGSATTAGEVSSSSARNSHRAHADATTLGPILNDKDRKVHPFIPKISIPLKLSELDDDDNDAFCSSGRVPFTDRSSLSAASPRIDITPRVFSASNNGNGNSMLDIYGGGWQNHLSALSDNLSTEDEESVSRYSFSTAEVHQRAAKKGNNIDLDHPYQDDDFLSNDSPLFRALNESLKQRPNSNSNSNSSINYINRQYDELSLVNSLNGDATLDYPLQHSPSNDSMVLSTQTRRSRAHLHGGDTKLQQDDDLSSIFRGWSNFSASQDLYPLKVPDGSMGAGYLLQPQTTDGDPLYQRSVIEGEDNSAAGGLSEPASSTNKSDSTAAAGVGSGNKENSQKLPPGLFLS